MSKLRELLVDKPKLLRCLVLLTCSFVFIGLGPARATLTQAGSPVSTAASGDSVHEALVGPPPLPDSSEEPLWGPGDLLETQYLHSYTPAEVADAAGVPWSPYGADVYRVWYLSQAPFGTPRIVSGAMVVPTGEIPPGGLPVLAFAHGTTGLADKCAPSEELWRLRMLLDWIPYGYFVSATDYVGLGTPALHPYFVGEAEAFSVLDSARATLSFGKAIGALDNPAANKVLLSGISQGGQAALFAHQAWSSGYGAELNVLGTVAFAPGSELRYLVQSMAASRSPLVSWAGMAMYAFSEYYGTPQDPAEWLLEPYASELPERIESECAARIGLWLGFDADKVFRPDLLAAIRDNRWEDLQPWTNYLDTNTPGDYSSTAPVLVLHGTADYMMPPETSQSLMDRLCDHGTPARLSYYEDVGHMGILGAGMAEALTWIQGRLDGVPAPNDCP